MSITREERTELHDLVRATMGERLADLLMAGLDAVDLAAMEERLTLRVENSRLELRSEMSELRGEFGELRGEFGELRGELRGEISGLRGELRAEISGLRGDMATGFAALRSEIGDRQRSTFIAVFTANAAAAGLVLAALQIAA